MRNLKSVFHQEVRAPENLRPSAIAWDAGDDSIICAFGPTKSSPKITLRRKCHDKTTNAFYFDPITSWDAPCPLPDLQSDEIICLQYFSDTASSCLILAGGDLVVVREDPQDGEEKVEIVGSVDTGIAAAAWAPDEELLAIVTRADTLILMTRYFEPVTDSKLTIEDLEASKHVSVGWGKRETQFQGKRAKALRDPTMPERVDEGNMSPFDNGRSYISWRGDGAFLAINRLVPNGRRVIRIMTREGLIDGASEPIDGLESALSWRPAGNLLAGVQRLTDRLDVVFFERNGLRHGEFSLRLSRVEIETCASDISLSWNVDSTVLAVSFRDRVQLWTMGNYHYYLKREILFDCETPVSSRSLAWHPEKPLRMVTISKDRLIEAEYLFCVQRGSTATPHDNGIVAVIDGKSLKLTPLKYSMVPPPMSSSEIVTGENIADCSIDSSGTYVAILTAAAFEVYEWDFRSNPAIAPKKVARLLFASQAAIGPKTVLRQILVHSEDRIKLLSHFETAASKIYNYRFETSSGATLIDTIEDLIPFEEDEGGLFRNTYEYILKQKGERLDLLLLQSALPSSSAINPSSEVLLVKGYGEHEDDVDNYSSIYNSQVHDRTHILSLSRKGELFADGKLLTRGCTSFVTTEAHLVFTTSQQLLKFVHIHMPDGYDVPGDIPEADERCRSIERGAKIVTVVPSIYAVILQMPRGNLETIYPRALVLAGIRRHLDGKDFKSSFLACQNHQVDMNIIYDYRPDHFMNNISTFIEQVRKISHIDLFLSKLSEEDVSRTLYKDTMPQREATKLEERDPVKTLRDVSDRIGDKGEHEGKVNRICDAFLSILKPKISKHLRNIITAQVCKRPPDLVSALGLVGSLRRTDPDKAEEAVSHLCFLSDVNRLYDTALSLYDLPLTLLVAQQAQRDPREYMPFLQSLNALSELRRKFRIDDHLRDYPRALKSLHALAAHEEVETYTTRHALYPQALKLYRYDSEHLTIITRLHATYLTSQSNHVASAIASESLHDYVLASASFAKCSPPRWREALHCASMAHPWDDTSKLGPIALQLATTLTEEQRDYRSASQIYTDYLHDIPRGARLLCKGSYFAESLRLLSLNNLTALIPDIIDTSLAEKSGEVTELIADCRAQLSAQVPRIQELRLKKAEDPLAFFGGDAAGTLDGGEGDIPDNISLAPTDASTLGGQSLFTRYGQGSNLSTRFGGTVTSHMSRQTSKTRRREERKRARGKKGSVYEEEYLVASFARLVAKVNGLHDEVRRLVEGLLRRGMRDRCEVVEEAVLGMVQECSRAVRLVWGSSGGGEAKEASGGEDGGGNGNGNGNGELGRGEEKKGLDTRPKGADGVFWESQVEMQQGGRAAPEVKAWKALDL